MHPGGQVGTLILQLAKRKETVNKKDKCIMQDVVIPYNTNHVQNLCSGTSAGSCLSKLGGIASRGQSNLMQFTRLGPMPVEPIGTQIALSLEHELSLL